MRNTNCLVFFEQATCSLKMFNKRNHIHHSNPGFTTFFGKFWSTLGRPHVGPCASGAHVWDKSGWAHMWDKALVGACDGGTVCVTRTYNYTWLRVGPDPCFLFWSCFVTITLLFCDVSLLSSLVPDGIEQEWLFVTKQVRCSVTILWVSSLFWVAWHRHSLSVTKLQNSSQ
jgi:hypothetical protein